MFALVTALMPGSLAAEVATVSLPDAPGLYERWDPDRSWGAPLLIDTLTEVALRLAWSHPYIDPIVVGDLSRRGGGPLFGHRTHDIGIDADLGLYTRGGRQPDGFVDITPEDLDVEATWALLTALLDTGNVRFILLDQGHIDRIRRWLRARGTPASRIDAVFVPPSTPLNASRWGVVRHAPNHRSHLHVRVGHPPSID